MRGAKSGFFIFIFYAVFLWGAIGALTFACKSLHRVQPDESEIAAFFPQSVRRTPTDAEMRPLLRVPTGCSGFWVSNAAGKPYVMTARHCFKKQKPEDWCAGNSFVDANGLGWRCSKILILRPKSDFVLLEAEFPAGSGSLQPNQMLALAGYHPELKTRLQMLGYPGDKARGKRATLTENCEINSGLFLSPFKDRPEHPDQLDNVKSHTCTSYGGNSGGAMVEEGTNTAVGMPYTYLPKVIPSLKKADQEDRAYMATMAEFVSANYEALTKTFRISIRTRHTPAIRAPDGNPWEADDTKLRDGYVEFDKAVLGGKPEHLACKDEAYKNFGQVVSQEKVSWRVRGTVEQYRQALRHISCIVRVAIANDVDGETDRYATYWRIKAK